MAHSFGGSGGGACHCGRWQVTRWRVGSAHLHSHSSLVFSHPPIPCVSPFNLLTQSCTSSYMVLRMTWQLGSLNVDIGGAVTAVLVTWQCLALFGSLAGYVGGVDRVLGVLALATTMWFCAGPPLGEK